MKFVKTIIAFGIAACTLCTAFAQDAVIRKNLAERLPNLPKIDEVTKHR